MPKELSLMVEFKEEWKEIKEAPEYSISNFGRVWSGKTKKFLSNERLDFKGYNIVTLYNGKPIYYKIHKLVAIYFVGERPEGFTINHIDGIKTNNSWLNLEYLTNKQNCIHAFKNGIIKRKLEIKDVKKIRRLHKKGCTQKMIADLFNIGPYHVSRIITKKQWGYI